MYFIVLRSLVLLKPFRLFAQLDLLMNIGWFLNLEVVGRWKHILLFFKFVLWRNLRTFVLVSFLLILRKVPPMILDVSICRASNVTSMHHALLLVIFLLLINKEKSFAFISRISILASKAVIFLIRILFRSKFSTITKPIDNVFQLHWISLRF